MPPKKPDLPATPPKAAEDYQGDLNLTGTEPFWGVQIRKGQITLSRPDHPDVAAPNPGPSINGGTATWDAGELTVTLKPGRCSPFAPAGRTAFSPSCLPWNHSRPRLS